MAAATTAPSVPVLPPTSAPTIDPKLKTQTNTDENPPQPQVTGKRTVRKRPIARKPATTAIKKKKDAVEGEENEKDDVVEETTDNAPQSQVCHVFLS